MVASAPEGARAHLISSVQRVLSRAVSGGFSAVSSPVNLGFVDPACVTHITTTQFQAMKRWLWSSRLELGHERLISPRKTIVQVDSSAFVADPHLIQALESRSTTIPCETDRILFKQDDLAAGVYILHQGVATLTMNAYDGRTIFCVEASAGSLLGLPGVVSEQPYSLTAIARAGAKVSFVSTEDFTALMKSEPLLSLQILQVLAAEVRTARKALL
jgi:hypothetical protein